MKFYVLHSSMYGHSQVLGNAIADGAGQVEGMEVIFKSVDDTDPNELKDAVGIIWGTGGVFGEPNVKMATFLGKLGQLWYTGALQGKVGGVFATTTTQHGGVENVCRALQTPMYHHGMVVVSHTGPISPERAQYGNPYGVTAVITPEESPTAPMNKPNDTELQFAREYGKHVAEIAKKLHS